MNILAVESSCDDLSWAVVQNGQHVLAQGIASQVMIHAETGGVVPEVASREHMRTVLPVLESITEKIPFEEIDAIAVTQGPGLIGSLLVGLTCAKTLALCLQKPLIPVHHIEGHIAANWLERDPIQLEGPKVILTVSGGHNDLYLMHAFGSYQHIGMTMDDAAGEAFDKVARMLGLGYPGGPAIEKCVQTYAEKYGHRENPYTLPRAYGAKDELLFSFSGLKSEVRRQVMAEKNLSDEQVFFLAYEFQESVTDVLTKKLFDAGKKYGVEKYLVTGGVSASARLQEKVRERASVYHVAQDAIFFPVKKLYSTDNAAMIGCAAFFAAQHPSRICRSTQDIIQLSPHGEYAVAAWAEVA